MTRHWFAFGVGILTLSAACDRPGAFRPPECMAGGDYVEAILGGADDPSSILNAEVDVIHLPDGHWVVAGVDEYADILMYDAAGRFIRTLLRKGAGPDEVMDTQRMTLGSGDSVWISDAGRRVLVVSSSTWTGRTISAFRGAIHGFTSDSGLPYEVLVKGVEIDTGVPLVRIWTRTGDSVSVLGPGSSAPWTGGRAVRVVRRNGVWLASSRLAWSSLETRDGTLIEEWTPDGVRPLLHQDSLFRALGVRVVDPTRRSWVQGIIGSSDGQFIAVVNVAPVHSATGKISERSGAVIAATADGTILFAAPLLGVPRGIVDSTRYYTVDEAESGLLQVVIRRIPVQC